jgi:hypothetical protein
MLDIPTKFYISPDLPEVKPGELVLSSSSSTATISLDLLKQINSNGVRPGELSVLLAAIAQEQERQDALDEEINADMVSYRTKTTGVDNTVFISVENPRHGPRIKVAIDPPTHVDPVGNNASVSIADGSIVAGGALPSNVHKQVRRFIELNRNTLLDYWHKRIDTDDLKARLQKI